MLGEDGPEQLRAAQLEGELLDARGARAQAVDAAHCRDAVGTGVLARYAVQQRLDGLYRQRERLLAGGEVVLASLHDALGDVQPLVVDKVGGVDGACEHSARSGRQDE